MFEFEALKQIDTPPPKIKELKKFKVKGQTKIVVGYYFYI